MDSTRTTSRTTSVALRCLALLTLVLGVGYPLAITGIGQLAFPRQSNGSPATMQGTVVGSALLGQGFTAADGTPLPRYFQSRPSAAGEGDDAGASAGSNLGLENPELVASISARRGQIAEFEGAAPAAVPADALTASSSGLDPHISPEYALLQVPRVAAARGVAQDAMRTLVDASIQGRDLGFLGEARVNVLELNIALDELEE